MIPLPLGGGVGVGLKVGTLLYNGFMPSIPESTRPFFQEYDFTSLTRTAAAIWSSSASLPVIFVLWPGMRVIIFSEVEYD